MTEQILAAKIKTLLRAWFVSLLSSNLFSNSTFCSRNYLSQ